MARVLLIDDDPVQLELRRKILEYAGHEVQTASTADEALEHTEGWDVAVLDLIPRHTQVRAALPDSTRVIVLSGRDPEPDVRADQVLKKPCASKELLAIIDSYGHSS